MTQISFEWRVSERDAGGFVLVLERLCGTDLSKQYGPMKGEVAESFIRARRDVVHRTIKTHFQAIKIFEPIHPAPLLQQ